MNWSFVRTRIAVSLLGLTAFLPAQEKNASAAVPAGDATAVITGTVSDQAGAVDAHRPRTLQLALKYIF